MTIFKNRYLILSVIISLVLFYPLITLLTSSQVVSYHGPSNGLNVKVEEPPQEKYQDLNKQEVQSYHDTLNDNQMIKIPYKLVHLDFKGAPPKLSYLKQLLKQLKKSGANGLLIEYEDMFPYHLNISHRKAYDRKELKEFIEYALKLDFEVVPLIQTFGHLEYMLKLEEFKGLREVKDYPQEICPSNVNATNVVMEMVGEVIKFHQKIQKGSLRYVHIGCDEVFHIGDCVRCRGKDTKDLFLNHVKFVAKQLEKIYKVRAIIWDDMIRKFYTEELVKSGVGNLVDLMIWDYTEDVDHLVSPYLWPMYTQAFPNIWAASAFKGAFGESLYQVHIQRHALNHVSWLKVISRELPKIRNFRGIALTGWSRYDHFSVLCELLPTAIPSLVLNLEILKSQDLKVAIESTSQQLCTRQFDNLHSFNLDYCTWPGTDLAYELKTLKELEQSSKELFATWSDSGKGWLTSYNIKYNETSYWRLEEVTMTAGSILEQFKSFESIIRDVLLKYFESYVADEWVVQRVGWVRDKLRSVMKSVEVLRKVTVWPRRPLVI